MVNKTFIEAEECYGFCVCMCVCVCACMYRQTCVCLCVREGECVSLSLCLWCWASCSDPTECTILSTNKGPAVPPNFNRGLLQHHRLFAAELTKYFPFCPEFVSVNSFVIWVFLLWLFGFDWRLLDTQVATLFPKAGQATLVLLEVKNPLLKVSPQMEKMGLGRNMRGRETHYIGYCA